MRAFNRFADKSLAVVLSLSILFPSLGSAAAVGAQKIMVGAARPGLSGAAGMTMISMKLAPLAPASTLNTPNVGRTDSVVSAPVVVAPAAAPEAVMPESVLRHPVAELLNKLQKAGITLPDAATNRADADQLLIAAQAMPEGAAKESMVAMAKAVMSGSSDLQLGQVYDNGSQASGQTENEAAPVQPTGAQRFWSAMAKIPGLTKYALGRAERTRPKASLMDPKRLEVPLERLRFVPPPEILPNSTKEIPAGNEQVVGQDNAVKSVKFGLKMPGDNYNLYVSGPEGSGRATAVRQLVNELAPTMATPNDLVAATNFSDEENPVVLELAPGQGAAFEEAVSDFVSTMQQYLPQVLGTGELAAAKKQMHDAYEAGANARQEALNAKVAAIKSGKFGFAIEIQRTEEGVNIMAAVTYEGQPMTQEEVDAKIAAGEFTADDWQEAQAKTSKQAAPLLQETQVLMAKGQEEHAAVHQKMAALDRQAAGEVVKQAAQPIMAAVANAASSENDEAHQALHAKTLERQAAFDAEVAKVKVGKFGLIIAARQQGGKISLMAGLTINGEQITQDNVAAKVAAGEFTEAEFAAAQGQLKTAIQPYTAKFKAMMELNVTEHAAIHAAEKPAAPLTKEQKRAMGYVQALMRHASANYRQFLPHEDKADPNGVRPLGRKQDASDAYRVSVLVDNAGLKGAPVVWENNPTYENLFGAAESNAQTVLIPGAGLVKTKGAGGPTLKGGSYLKARGGFLILNVMDVLREPGAWQSLMAAIRSGDAQIAEGGLQGLASMKGSRYSVPVKTGEGQDKKGVKVVLIGAPTIRMLLRQHDQDFGSNFNAMAEFEPSLALTRENAQGYMYFLKKAVVGSGGEIMDLTRDAISSVLEFSARIVDSNTKLSAQFGTLYSLLREATFWARESGRAEVSAADINQALGARGEREAVYQRHYLEMYKQDIFHVATAGKAVGQINGLAVMGGFGVPMRITVVHAPGSFNLGSADKEAGTTGSSYNKSFAVLRGFLSHVFKRVIPANISISFEQNYGGIDGDSATTTMMYSVLSSLSGVPIKQSFAVTGSADQFGNVQAIGGVNEKIEGFFDIASSRPGGLTGEQGIVIPASNVGDLMLRADVVEAVRQGKFKIYAVKTVAEGLEILTGTPYSEIIRKANAGFKTQ